MKVDGRKIRQLRQLKGLCLVDLAKAAGVDHSWVSRIENNRSDPSPRVVSRIATALDVAISELVPSGEAKPNNGN